MCAYVHVVWVCICACAGGVVWVYICTCVCAHVESVCAHTEVHVVWVYVHVVCVCMRQWMRRENVLQQFCFHFQSNKTILYNCNCSQFSRGHSHWSKLDKTLYVCVCVCERERESVCVCMRVCESERETERECVCVSMCVLQQLQHKQLWSSGRLQCRQEVWPPCHSMARWSVSTAAAGHKRAVSWMACSTLKHTHTILQSRAGRREGGVNA